MAENTKIEWADSTFNPWTSANNWNLPPHWNREPFAGCTECGWRGVPVKKAGHTFHCGACGHINLSPIRRRCIAHLRAHGGEELREYKVARRSAASIEEDQADRNGESGLAWQMPEDAAQGNIDWEREP